MRLKKKDRDIRRLVNQNTKLMVQFLEIYQNQEIKLKAFAELFV